MNKLKYLLDHPEKTAGDATINLKSGKTITIHKNILMATSPVFRRMFNSKYEEAHKGVLDGYKEYDDEIVIKFIKHLYTGIMCDFGFDRNSDSEISEGETEKEDSEEEDNKEEDNKEKNNKEKNNKKETIKGEIGAKKVAETLYELSDDEKDQKNISKKEEKKEKKDYQMDKVFQMLGLCTVHEQKEYAKYLLRIIKQEIENHWLDILYNIQCVETNTKIISSETLKEIYESIIDHFLVKINEKENNVLSRLINEKKNIYDSDMIGTTEKKEIKNNMLNIIENLLFEISKYESMTKKKMRVRFNDATDGIYAVRKDYLEKYDFVKPYVIKKKERKPYTNEYDMKMLSLNNEHVRIVSPYKSEDDVMLYKFTIIIYIKNCT
jgi:hypothetical protein